MTTPDQTMTAAVEAAARAVADARGLEWDGPSTYAVPLRRQMRGDARTALTAALPLLTADAVEQARAEGAAGERERVMAELAEQIGKPVETGEPSMCSQIRIRDLDAATANDLRAELVRIDNRLRHLHDLHNASSFTSLVVARELARQRDAAIARTKPEATT